MLYYKIREIVEEKTNKTIENFSNRIERLEISIEKDMEELEKYKNAEKIESTDEEIDKAYENIKLIIENENTKEVYLVNDTLKIITNDLDIKEPVTGKTFFLGKMEIQMPLELTSRDILMFNRTATKCAYESNMNAPHVFSNGKSCFGNMSEMLAITTSSNDYYATYVMLLQFLQTCNIEDEAGRLVATWNEIDPVTRKVIHEGRDAQILFEDGEIGCRDDMDCCSACNEYVLETYECCDCHEYFCGNCCEEFTDAYDDNYTLCNCCIEDNLYTCAKCGEFLIHDRSEIEWLDGKPCCTYCYEELTGVED